jgi:hypothetical protein
VSARRPRGGRLLCFLGAINQAPRPPGKGGTPSPLSPPWPGVAHTAPPGQRRVPRLAGSLEAALAGALRLANSEGVSLTLGIRAPPRLEPGSFRGIPRTGPSGTQLIRGARRSARVGHGSFRGIGRAGPAGISPVPGHPPHRHVLFGVAWPVPASCFGAPAASPFSGAELKLTTRFRRRRRRSISGSAVVRLRRGHRARRKIYYPPGHRGLGGNASTE